MTRLFALTLLLAVATAADAQRLPITTASDAARLHYVAGVAALTHADFASALPHLDAAIAADPSFAMAHMYRAVATANGRDEHMRHATTHGARASEAERQQIASYAASLAGDPDRSIAIERTLATRFPNDPLPMFIVGNNERIRGNHAEAIAAFRGALAADPSFGGAYNLMGYSEMARGDMAAAEQAFRDYIRVAPDHANPYDSYGEFLMEAGRMDEAEAQFEMALTRNPEFTASRNHLVRIAITRAFQGYVAAINSHDAIAYAAFYTAGAVMSPPDGSQLVGRPAIYEDAVPFFAGQSHVQAFETQEITPMGDGFAYHRTTISTRIDGGAPDEGINSFIWVRTPEGWKISRDTWTSNAATAAAGSN